MPFAERVQLLPRLGLGVSTEYGAGDAAGALDVLALRTAHPRYAQFLEVGVETARGLDRHARAWVEHGHPTTCHYLDVNLDEPEDFDDEWLDDVRAIAAAIRPAWMCGDAGLWHLGRRERGHMLLLPPVLTPESADGIADGVVRLRDATGYDVLPENPPGQVFLGSMHVLDFFARVADRADTGLLLDCAHSRCSSARGHAPLAGHGYPFSASSRSTSRAIKRTTDGFAWVEDDAASVLADVDHRPSRGPRAPNEGDRVRVQRNPMAACLASFDRLAALLDA
jgi:hypothetical protein